MKSKLPDNIHPCAPPPSPSSWAANNRCCARLKDFAALRDALKVERRESEAVSVTAGPALERCDRGYICAGFRALQRGWVGRVWRGGEALEVEVKGKPAPALHHVSQWPRSLGEETSLDLTADLGSGWGLRLHQHQQLPPPPAPPPPVNPSHIRASAPALGHAVLAARLHTKSLSFSQAYVSTLPRKEPERLAGSGLGPRRSVTAAVSGLPA